MTLLHHFIEFLLIFFYIIFKSRYIREIESLYLLYLLRGNGGGLTLLIFLFLSLFYFFSPICLYTFVYSYYFTFKFVFQSKLGLSLYCHHIITLILIKLGSNFFKKIHTPLIILKTLIKAIFVLNLTMSQLSFVALFKNSFFFLFIRLNGFLLFHGVKITTLYLDTPLPLGRFLDSLHRILNRLRLTQCLFNISWFLPAVSHIHDLI